MQPSVDKTKPSKRDHIEKVVERKIKAIVDATKATHSKYADPHFGPTEADPFGALSLYGKEPPTPAGVNKYPSPESMRWDRPHYENSFSQEDDVAAEETDEFADEFGDISKSDVGGNVRVPVVTNLHILTYF